jgi:hypothetical protein
LQNEDKLEANEMKEDVTQPRLIESSSKASMTSDRRRALSEAKKNPPPEYNPEMAVELERLEQSSFKPSFYEAMEVLNYDRYIDMEKYVYPEFIYPPQ